MNKTDQVLKNKILKKIINKIISLSIISFVVSVFLILFSFNPDDTGWGVISETPITNIYGEKGSYVSGFIIKEFGILPALLLLSVMFIWALKF